MTNLLPLLLLLACPLMMVFMMRGMHGGGDRTRSGRGPQVDHHEPHSTDVQFTGARIEALEREIASLRSAQSDQPQSARGHRP